MDVLSRWMRFLGCLLLLSFALVFLPSKLASAEEEKPSTEVKEIPKELAEQYRASVKEREDEVKTLGDDVERTEEAIGILERQLAAEKREARTKDLRTKIEQLKAYEEELNSKLEKHRKAVSEGKEPEKAFYSVAGGDLQEREKRREEEIGDLESRIESLKKQLELQTGRQGRQKNLQQQIEELSRDRDELANRPAIDATKLTEPEAVQEELAKPFAEREAKGQKDLEDVRTKMAALEKQLEGEKRQVRRKNIEAQIERLKLQEHELGTRPEGAPAEEGEAAKVIERGLKVRQMETERRREVLDKQVATLRGKLRTEKREARRKSLLLQIQEIENQKEAVGKPQSKAETPQGKGFVGAPYGSPSDPDYAYKSKEEKK
jgi:hypothetical protein